MFLVMITLATFAVVYTVTVACYLVEAVRRRLAWRRLPCPQSCFWTDPAAPKEPVR